MILLGSLDLEGNGGNFEELVNNEKRNVKKIIDKIIAYHPDLLLVEKNVNRIATEML